MAQPLPEETFETYRRIQVAADAQILRILADAYADLNRDLRDLDRGLKTAEIRRAKMVALKAQILRRQAEIFKKVGSVVEARRAQAAARSLDTAAKYDQALFDAIGRSDTGQALARGLAEANLQNIDVAIARLEGSSTSLSQRVYRAEAWSSGVLERRVNSALARGLTAQQFAKEVRDLVNPNTPGGVRYAALRLARTEINNAFHAMAIQAAQQKPWVKEMEWHLSKRHGRTDVCNQLAAIGKFPVDKVPKKPHPQCLCYVTPVVDLSQRGTDEFLDDLVSGRLDDFLDEFADRQGLTGRRPAKKATKSTVTPPVKAVKKAAPRKAPAKKVQPVRPGREIGGTFVPDIGYAPSNRSITRATKTLTGERGERIRRSLNRQAVITPETARRLKSVKDGAMASGDRALMEYWPGQHASSNRIVINERSYDLPAGWHAQMEAQNWFSHCGHDHGAAESLVAHEYGHHVHNTMNGGLMTHRETSTLVAMMRTEFGIQDLPTDFDPRGPGMEAWFKRHKSTIAKMVSEYGTTNLMEFCAEVWAEYSTHPNPRPHIKVFGDYMKQRAEQNARILRD